MVTMILGIVRHVLTGLGGGLVTSGYASADEVNLIVGAVITIVGVLWSIWEKRQGK